MIAALLTRGCPDRAPTFRWHVDPAAGSNTTGTGTKALPYATVAKALSVAASGDGVGVKAGTTTREATISPALSQLRFGTYGVGAQAIMSGGQLVTTWTATSGGTYSAALTTTTPYVTSTTAGTTTPLTLGSGSGTLSANQFFWSANVLFVNLGGTNPNTTTIEAAIRGVILATASHNLVLRGLEFRHGADRMVGIFSGASPIVDQCTLRYCCFTANSGSLAFSNNTGSGRVTRSVFSDLQNDGVWVHNSPNVQIDNNTTTRIGTLAGDVASDGIQFEDTFGTAPNSDGAWVHHNTITMGAATPKGCIIMNCDPTITGASTSGIVELNTCTGGNYAVAMHSSNLTVRNNVMINQVSAFGGGIHVATGGSYTGMVIAYNLIYGSSRDGIVIQDGSTDHQVTIVHNTIVDCVRAQMYLGAPVWGVIENNILWNTGAAPTVRTLYIISVSTGHTLACDYNLLQTAFANYLRFGGTAYSTLAAWRTATALDAHSLSGDPLFTNAAAHSYTLTGGSPAINAGVVVGGVNQVVLGAAPDIGYAEAA